MTCLEARIERKMKQHFTIITRERSFYYGYIADEFIRCSPDQVRNGISLELNNETGEICALENYVNGRCIWSESWKDYADVDIYKKRAYVDGKLCGIDSSYHFDYYHNHTTHKYGIILAQGGNERFKLMFNDGSPETFQWALNLVHLYQEGPAPLGPANPDPLLVGPANTGPPQ